MTTTAAAPKQALLQRLEGLRQIPTIPAVLAPLLRYLQQPVEQIDVQKVTDLLSQDKSLAAQCLQMANSPLFGRARNVQSLRAAVVSLGFHHVSDIAMSCGVLNMLPCDKSSLDPVVFWEHSLGCALICRHLARKIAQLGGQQTVLDRDHAVPARRSVEAADQTWVGGVSIHHDPE